jgi:hypothetical protein
MPGIRLHHESLKAPATVAVECARGYRQPYQCPLCGTTHNFKTVHLRLNGKGDVIVSKGVWKDLKDVPGLPFRIANEIKNPPKTVLSLENYEGPQTRDLHHHRFEGRR